MRDVSLLILRTATGGLLAGHGAQKLFGSFDGPGPQGTAKMMESLNLQPSDRWALMAGLSEFGGGALTALGLFGPLGPIASMGSMIMAATTAHWGKPIWATSGGAELPLTNIAVLSSVAVSGPGSLSLDRLFGIRVPWWMSGLALAGTAAGIAAAHVSRLQAMQASIDEEPVQAKSATDAQGDIVEPVELPRAA